MITYFFKTPNIFKYVKGEDIRRTFSGNKLSADEATDKFYAWLAENFEGYTPEAISMSIVS